MSQLFTSGGQSIGVSASVSLSLSKHLGCNFFHFYFPSSIVFHLVFFVHFVNILTSFTVLLSLFVSGKRGSVWLFSTNKSEVFIVHLRRTTGCPQMKHLWQQPDTLLLYLVSLADDKPRCWRVRAPPEWTA